MRSPYRISIFLGIAWGVLALSACRGITPTQTVTATVTITATSAGLTLQAPPTEIAYPGPSDENPPTSTPEGYPPPGGISESPVAVGSPYPNPVLATPVATLPLSPTVTQVEVSTTTPEAYPGPGTAVALAPSPTLEGAYPGPVDSTQPAGPYPPPATAPPPRSVTPTAQVTQPSGQATATPLATGTIPAGLTATPSITPTPPLVRTRLEASDPASFKPASGGMQLVEFFAFWSPLSKSMAPVMNGLEERYRDRVNFVYLDIDDPANSLYKLLLNDRLPPIFYLLDGEGNVLDQWQGYVPQKEFEDAFSSPGV